MQLRLKVNACILSNENQDRIIDDCNIINTSLFEEKEKAPLFSKD
jgi:hypothetical protein